MEVVSFIFSRDAPGTLTSSATFGCRFAALRKEFGDSAFESRQDIFAGESCFFAEQAAFGGFAEDGGRASFWVDHPGYPSEA